jgi:cytochrome P450
MLSVAEADEVLASIVQTDDGLQDPYSRYDALRAGSPRWRSNSGAIVLTGYEDCLEALRHPKLGRAEEDMEVPSSFGQAERDGNRNTSTMLFLNPPDHTRIRSLVSRAFTPRRVEAMRGDFRALLDPILDRLTADGGGDVMAQLAVPFPVAVISELLGVPREGNEHIQPMVRAATSLIDAAADEAATEAGQLGVIGLAMYFVELVEAKKLDPDDRLLSALIQVEAEGDRLSPEELIANTILLYAAGFETTSNLIGNGLRLLLAHPAQLQRLRDEPGLLPSAILEMLRYDSPVQLNMRFALDEVDLFGQVHPRGTAFVVLQGGANHDPAAYDDPARFDVGRFAGGAAPQPLSFGWGAHHCLGAHLARAEGEIVFGELLSRTERIELDVSSLGDAGLRYRPSFTLRGLESLTVAVHRS